MPAGPFFVHLADPGFPDHPFPGERRSGPYLTEAEALEQAVWDACGNSAVVVGVYHEAESEKRAHSTARSVGKAVHTGGQVHRKAEALSKRLQKEAADARQADYDALAQILPPGMGIEQAVELLNEQAARMRAMQSSPDDFDYRPTDRIIDERNPDEPMPTMSPRSR